MRAAKVDKNQNEIVASLRKIGATVFIVSQLKNFVDIVVGYQGVNYLFEIKSDKGKLRENQKELQDSWKGKIYTVYSFDQILEIL